MTGSLWPTKLCDATAGPLQTVLCLHRLVIYRRYADQAGEAGADQP